MGKRNAEQNNGCVIASSAMEPIFTIYETVNCRNVGQVVLSRIPVLPKVGGIVLVNGKEYEVVTVNHEYSTQAGDMLSLNGVKVHVRVTTHQAEVDDTNFKG